MGFIDSYKHLEKLCGEVLNDDRRISAYIDEMTNTPRGSYYVRTWNEDLKKLKHYRWVRNQISHEPDCTEQNMCKAEDEIWLDEFYSKIMNQTDPLTLYHRAINPRPVINNTAKSNQSIPMCTGKNYQKNSTRRGAGCVILIGALLLIFGIIVLLSITALN